MRCTSPGTMVEPFPMLSLCASTRDSAISGSSTRTESRPRLDPVLVDDPEMAESRVLGVVVIGEGEAVVGAQPAVFGAAAVLAFADFDHLGSPCRPDMGLRAQFVKG